mmetsp:Transcript_39588/g.93271  ORF Transcript_39588/g.93271 Transcript_39588/m.93271 type:complete len:1256 (-) Transcript_39588:146-3913(-)
MGHRPEAQPPAERPMQRPPPPTEAAAMLELVDDREVPQPSGDSEALPDGEAPGTGGGPGAMSLKHALAASASTLPQQAGDEATGSWPLPVKERTAGFGRQESGPDDSSEQQQEQRESPGQVNNELHGATMDLLTSTPTLAEAVKRAGSPPEGLETQGTKSTGTYIGRAKREVSGRSLVTTVTSTFTDSPVRMVSHPGRSEGVKIEAAKRLSSPQAIPDRSDSEDAYDRIYKDLERITRASALDKDAVSELLHQSYRFDFKNKKFDGGPLHIACNQPGSSHNSNTSWWVVQKLLELNADIHGFCVTQPSSKSSQKVSQLLPLHIAAGTAGNEGVIEALVTSGAEIDRKGLYSDKNSPNKPYEHYTPLHEAVYFGYIDNIEKLLELRADPNVANKDHQTPLHIAAKAVNQSTGISVEVARRLISRKADKSARDWQARTALTTAVTSPFPSSKLHLLAHKSMSEILEVSRLDPASATELLRDRKKMSGRGVHDAWLEPLSEGHDPATVNQFVELLKRAPRAAGDVLDVLTAKGKAPPADKFHYPVPMHARPNRWGTRRATYEQDRWWECKDGEPPAWHFDLCAGHDWSTNRSTVSGSQLPRTSPSRQGKHRNDGCLAHWLHKCMSPLVLDDEKVRVHVKVLLLPCIVDLKLLFELQQCEWKKIFQVEAVQALLDFAWAHLVRRHYIAHFSYRFLELLVLILIAQWPPKTDFWMDASWSFLATTSIREILMELMQLRAHALLLNDATSYFGFYNLLDLGSMGLFAILIGYNFESRDFFHDDVSQGMLATVCFLRWVQMLYMMRAFEYREIGVKIVPLFQSFFNVGGIFFVTMLLFVAISHSFLVLDPSVETVEGPDIRDTTRILLQAFRMLFAGDGDGINFLLSITGHGEDGSYLTQLFVYIAYTTFGIFTLNLFIAVHGAAFNAAQESSMLIFYQHRASICLGGMMQPSGFRNYFPGWEYHDMLVAYVPLVFAAPLVWVFLLSTFWFHPIVPSAVLACILRIGDRMLLSRPCRRHIEESPDFLPMMLHRAKNCFRMCASRYDKIMVAEKILGADVVADSKPPGGDKASLKPNAQQAFARHGSEMSDMSAGPSPSRASSASGSPLGPGPRMNAKEYAKLKTGSHQASEGQTPMHLWWCGWDSRKAGSSVSLSPKGDIFDQAVMDKMSQMSDRIGGIEKMLVNILRRLPGSHSADFDLSIPGLGRNVSPSVHSTGSFGRKATTALASPSGLYSRDMTPKKSEWDKWAASHAASSATARAC